MQDTNGLDCDSEGDEKIYCPGIGLVIDGDAELTEFEIGGDDDDDDEDDDGNHRHRRHGKRGR